MASYVEGLDEFGETSVLYPVTSAIPNPDHVDQDLRAGRTNRISKEVFASLAPYMAGNTVLANHVTPPTDDAKAVSQAASSTGIVSRSRAFKNERFARHFLANNTPAIVGNTVPDSEPPEPLELPAEEVRAETAESKGLAAGFPHLSWEILRAGLMKEGITIKQLNELSGSIEQIQQKLEKILSFNQKLTKLPSNQDNHPITDEMREDIRVLKEMGIDLLSPDEKSISGEKLAMIKTDLDGLKSKFQTDMQSKFMNVQTKTSQYNSLLDSLKIVEKHFSRLLSTILQNMTKR